MKVTLYSTHCPRCNVLETKLGMAGVSYEIVEDEDVMINKGFTSSPMLEVDDKIMDFSAAIKWLNGME